MPLIGWLGLCPGALFAVLLALTDYPVLVQDAVGGVLAGVGMAVELLLGEAMPQPMGPSSWDVRPGSGWGCWV